MQVVITQITPQNIYDWAMKSMMKNGKVTFEIESGSAPMSIEFKNAYCVGFQRTIDTAGSGLSTTLTIAPEEITINGIDFDNHWVK